MMLGRCVSFEAFLRKAPQDEANLQHAAQSPPHPEERSKAKPRRTLSIAAILFLFGLFSSAPAQACSCIRIAPEGFRQQAAAIIEGRVVSVKREGDTNGRVTARIAVSKRVKGKTPPTVIVSTRGNSAACGVEFKAGQRGEFLLARENGRYSTNLCLMLGARQ